MGEVMTAEQTCEGCRYYKCTDEGYMSRMYQHWCYIEPQPIQRVRGESHYAPVACSRREEKGRADDHPDAPIWRTAIAWCQHNSGMDEDCGQVGPDDRRHACPERKRCPLQKSLAALAAKKEAG